MDWLDQFNWMDYALLTVSAVFVVGGYLKGFTRQVLQLAGIVAAFYAALVYTPRVVEMGFLDALRAYNSEVAGVITFVGIFVTTMVVWNLLVEVVSRWLPGRRLLRPFDGLLGGVLGGIKAVLIVGGVCLGLMTWGNLKQFDPFRNSVLAPRLAAGCSTLVLLIPEGTRQEMHDFNEMVHDELHTRKLLNPGVHPALAPKSPAQEPGKIVRPRQLHPRHLLQPAERTQRIAPRRATTLKPPPRFDPRLAPRPPSQAIGKRASGRGLGHNIGQYTGGRNLSSKRSSQKSTTRAGSPNERELRIAPRR